MIKRSRKGWALLTAASLLGITALFNQCTRLKGFQNFSIKGTEIGNPMRTEAAAKILRSICTLMSRCHTGVTVAQCEAGVQASGGIDFQLGLPSATYRAYSAIMRDEEIGNLKANLPATDTCDLNIENLACTNPAVLAAYDPSLSNPFLGTAQLIAGGSCSTVFAPAVKAFPSAEGFGQNAVGGRGGRVIHVTNLNDSGPGSLRGAMLATGSRMVVFDVSGTIELHSNISLDNPDHSFLTVGGQTSPGGIQLKGPFGIWLSYGVHDIILRHLRVRPGGPALLPNTGAAFGIYAPDLPVYNVVVDHCSFQWFNDASGSRGNIRDVVFQWNLIGPSLLNPEANADGSTLYLAGAANIPDGITMSFHHNLIALGSGDMPTIAQSGVFDFRNNVVYGWSGNNGMRWGIFSSNRSTFGNSINNHYIPGPASDPPYFWLSNGGPTRIDGSEADRGGTRIFASGNWGIFCPQGCADDWDNRYTMLDYYEYNKGPERPLAPATMFRSLTEFAAPRVTTDPTSILEDKVLAGVGANRPNRDSVDSDVILDVRNRSGTIPSTAGQWPTLSGGSPPLDTDQDGMPDVWELAHSLDSADPGDGAAVTASGYTNLEKYLNELAGD